MMRMTKNEARRKLVRLGATIEKSRGKGGHVLVTLNGRRSYLPTGSGELKTGTLRAILRDLGLTSL
jgi:predicted RNA binding protein YcfA (HicA-like mRNA interferase family)